MREPTGKGLLGRVGAEPTGTIGHDLGPLYALNYVLGFLMTAFLLWRALGSF